MMKWWQQSLILESVPSGTGQNLFYLQRFKNDDLVLYKCIIACKRLHIYMLAQPMEDAFSQPTEETFVIVPRLGEDDMSTCQDDTMATPSTILRREKRASR